VTAALVRLVVVLAWTGTMAVAIVNHRVDKLEARLARLKDILDQMDSVIRRSSRQEFR